MSSPFQEKLYGILLLSALAQILTLVHMVAIVKMSYIMVEALRFWEAVKWYNNFCAKYCSSIEIDFLMGGMFWTFLSVSDIGTFQKNSINNLTADTLHPCVDRLSEACPR